MIPEARKRWLIAAALALSGCLVMTLVWIERAGREARLAEEAEPFLEAFELPEGQDLPYAVFMEAISPNEATEETPLTPEQQAVMRKEFLDVALYQRRQLERPYLEVLRRLFERNPRYVSLWKGRSGWPYDPFEIDFHAFQCERAWFERAWTDEDRHIDALLGDIEEEMLQLLADFGYRPGAFSDGRKRLDEKSRQLDKAIEAASVTESSL